MIFERDGVKPISNVSEKQIRRNLKFVRGTFANLTSETGAYIQVAGWQSQCSLERRDSDGRQFRAFQEPAVVPYDSETQHSCSCGLITLRPTEYFRMAQVVDAFVAFLNGSPFPVDIKWREVTAELEEYGVG